MPECSSCLFEFPLLGSTKCGKCMAKRPGMAKSEYAAINDKPQCAGCGLSSDRFDHSLCPMCITHYKRAEQIPRSILALPGIRELLFGSEESSNVDFVIGNESATILAQARVHQAEASNFRFGQTVKTVGSVGSTANLFKARQVQAQRQQKQKEAKQLDTNIRITATLWQLHRERLTQVSIVRHVKTFIAETKTRDAFNSLLQDVQRSFQSRYPQAEQLTWANVSQLPIDRDKSIQHTWKNIFLSNKLGTDRELQQRSIAIRFVFERDAVFKQEEDDDDLLDSRKSSIRASGSKRKRSEISPSIVRSSRSSLAAKTSSVAATSSPDLMSAGPGAKIILRSAYRPPTVPATRTQQWTRNIKTFSSNFKRFEATFINDGGPKSGQVSISQTVTREVIHVADKSTWMVDLPDGGWDFDNAGTGFIGKGSTKSAVYARFGSEEYVLTFPSDIGMRPLDVRQMLEEEYKLLAQCHAFKKEFDELAKKSNATPVAFYFNFERSIFGEFVPCPISNEFPIPHAYFLATPLLPCGGVDSKMRKFTGNGEIGRADDDITKTVHAFVHFSLLYSQRNVLFCDLQGMMDKHGIWCLFDPQSHTATRSSYDCAYWDKGSVEIKAFEQQHSAACDANWVCNRLRLQSICFEPDELATDAPSANCGGSGSPVKKQARIQPSVWNLID